MCDLNSGHKLVFAIQVSVVWMTPGIRTREMKNICDYIWSRSKHRNIKNERAENIDLSNFNNCNPLPLNQVSPLQSWGTRPGIISTAHPTPPILAF